MPSEFNVGQLAAVRNVFDLAGFEGEIRILPILSEDERIFVLPKGAAPLNRDGMSQILGQLLSRKVWIVEDGASVPESIPFPFD